MQHINYVAATPRKNFDDSSKIDLSLGGFIQTGTIDDAKRYFAQKKKETSDGKIKLYQLVEMEI